MSADHRTRGWRKTIRLKDLLSDDDSPGNVKLIAGEFAHRLKRQPEYHDFGKFSDVVDGFEGLSAEVTPSSRHFNDLLAELYDWADAERVWIA